MFDFIKTNGIAVIALVVAGIALLGGSGVVGGPNLDSTRHYNSQVFNDLGYDDADFTIEGDTDTSLFFVDASTDRVGIGTSSPTQLLTVGTTGTTSADLGKFCISARANDGSGVTYLYINSTGSLATTSTSCH